MSVAPAAPKSRSRKGPRPKHIPQRMCVACREKTAKRGLTRVVRTPEGLVEIDPTGKRNGRGAYLCDQNRCWDRALTSGLLDKALNTEVNQADQDELRAFADRLLGTEEPAATAPEGKNNT